MLLAVIGPSIPAGSLEIASLDAPLRPDPERDQAAIGDAATDGFFADLHQIHRLADRQQRLKRTDTPVMILVPR
jgi:hypothetical protein